VLVTPGDHGRLSVAEASESTDGSILTGTLRSDDGKNFPIREGVPRMAGGDTDSSEAVVSFSAKWASYSEKVRERLAGFQYRWHDERFGFGDEDGLAEMLADKRWVLDAGSGAGSAAARYARLSRAHVVGMDLSESVARAAEVYGDADNLDFVQGDILDPPFPPGSFDYVVSDQVIHHTPDCPRAFHTLAGLVRPGGQLAVYVYRVKPLLRELADEHVRAVTTRMSVEDCMEFSRQVTELGRKLSELNATVTLEQGIPLLGIEPGEHDVQRLIYWHFFKAFWNEELGEEWSDLVNFDWYHPPYASRHKEEEVLGWCRDAGLEVQHLDVIESGISVMAQRVA
jgi:SAM-dependent methyltransferase/uncharacterized protein YbaR (Trm112 family)